MREQFECAQDSKLACLGIAVVWFAGGMAFWLLSLVGIGFAERSGIALTVTAILILLVNTTIRLPILWQDSAHTENYDHAIYLLTLGSLVNWLGAIAANSQELNDILPAVILATLGEFWFVRQAWYQGKLVWLSDMRSTVLAQGNVLGLAIQRRGSMAAGERKSSSELIRDAGEEGDFLESWDEHVVHRTVAGTDPEGKAYVSGESLAAFEIGQTSTSIIVAFSPPFPNQPEMETECEEDVDIQVLHCTPIGCRLELKRRNRESSQQLVVGWYATSSTDNSASKSVLLP